MQYIYFTAEWCGPCKMIKPKVQSSGKPIQIVNVDSDNELANKYNIKSIPAIIGLEGGQVVERHIGAPAILSLLEK